MGSYKDEHGVTRAGKFLKGLSSVAPSVLELAGTVTGISALKDLGKKIKGDKNMSADDKETALALLQLDIQEAQEVTKRWESDNLQESWLPRNIRPMTLMFLVVTTVGMLFVDSMENVPFTLKPEHTLLLQTLLVTVIVAYFGSRGMEKYKKISNG